MNYVIAAYVATMVLVGGYALSIFMRRRAVRREMAAWQAGEPRESDGAPLPEADRSPAPDPEGAETP